MKNFSKLPLRQFTRHELRERPLEISKLPLRQFTLLLPYVTSPFFSKLPLRQFTVQTSPKFSVLEGSPFLSFIFTKKKSPCQIPR